MGDLKTLFEGLGFENISTHLQSGNVLFEAKRTSQNKLVDQIEKVLPGNTRAIVRSASELAELVGHDPFTPKHSDVKRRFVTLLREPADGLLRLKPSTEIVLRTEQEVCCYITSMPGRFEYPNIEGQLKVAATRGWGVVQRIAALCEQ